MKKEQVSFVEYKSNCKYYDKSFADRGISSGSFISCPPVYIENCTHPLAGKSNKITSKSCNEDNDFCLYKNINQ